MSRYFKRIAVVLDLLVNVLRGGQIETVSSACGKRVASGQPCRFCAGLCRLIDTAFGGRWAGHCMNNRREPYQ